MWWVAGLEVTMKTFTYKNRTWTVDNNIITDSLGNTLYVNEKANQINSNNKVKHAKWNGYYFTYVGTQRVRQHILLAAFYFVNREDYDNDLNMDKYVVHHINHDKTDNSKENLVLLTLAEHTWLHQTERRENRLDTQGKLVEQIIERRKYKI